MLPGVSPPPFPLSPPFPPFVASISSQQGPAASYDYATVHAIVNAAPVLHVAFPPSADPAADPFPAVLPMIGVMASRADPNVAPGAGPRDLYLHGSVSMRLQGLAASASSSSSSSSSTTANDSTAPDAAAHGLPVAASATLVDGYVLALTPFAHSLNYRSAVVHGFLTPVADAAERAWALERLTDAVVPGRWAGSRVPPTPAEDRQTGVLKVRVASASAKVRVGPPGRGDRKDEREEGVRGRVWTGVVPCWTWCGEGVPDEGNAVEVPAYLEEWRVRGNEGREAYAVGAAAEP